MRISDWSSDVCSSDLFEQREHHFGIVDVLARMLSDELGRGCDRLRAVDDGQAANLELLDAVSIGLRLDQVADCRNAVVEIEEAGGVVMQSGLDRLRSEEHTSELQSLMRNSYAVFCLKK